MTYDLIVHMTAIEYYLHVITFIYAVQDSSNFLPWVSLQRWNPMRGFKWKLLSSTLPWSRSFKLVVLIFHRGDEVLWTVCFYLFKMGFSKKSCNGTICRAKHILLLILYLLSVAFFIREGFDCCRRFLNHLLTSRVYQPSCFDRPSTRWALGDLVIVR